MANLNIGPGAIAEAGTEGGPGFILSKTEWIAIQTYVTDALALPITDAEFRKSLGEGAPKDLSDFGQLITAYKDINTHCTTWQDVTFKKTVDLASKIYEYGSTKAPVFYPPILKEAEILIADPENERAKAALKAILDNLQKQATDYAAEAKAVEHEIKTFSDQTEGDRVTLVGPRGDEGLVKYYNDKYGSTSKEVEDLKKDIDAQRIILKSANDEYDHDVIVAATTPTYGWFFPVGTIAAAVVAGIYGDKAVKALERARAAQDKINTLTDKLAADANLMVAIQSALIGTSTIVQALAAALPVVQKIQGVWGGIAADLAHIVDLIEKDIRQVPPIIMSLGVDEAVRAWYNVAKAANQYRVNAYVKQAGSPDLSMEAWRINRLVSSGQSTTNLRKVA